MNILFVCTGNTCRSPMAEAYFKEKAKENGRDWACASAGISAIEGENVSEHAVAAMNDLYQIDISEKLARPIFKEELQKANYVLTMTHIQKDYLIIRYPEFEKKIFLLTQIDKEEIHETGEEIHDPWGFQITSYKKTARQIAEHINQLFLFLERKVGEN
jgi:protein-tyrosine-phosphatase